MAQFKEIRTRSFSVSAYELQEAFEEGWRIDDDRPPITTLFDYEIALVKDMSRTEILEKARKAKKAKSLEE